MLISPLDMLSSNATVEGDGTGLTGLFDGRASNKHWHGNYSGSVFDAVSYLKKIYKHVQIQKSNMVLFRLRIKKTPFY